MFKTLNINLSPDVTTFPRVSAQLARVFFEYVFFEHIQQGAAKSLFHS